MLQIYLGTIRSEMENLMHWFFTEGFVFELTRASVYTLFQECLYSMAIMVLPIMLVIAVAAFITVRLQVGKLWAPKVFKPKFKMFNVVSGLKKLLISKQTFVRLAKSIFMAAAVAIWARTLSSSRPSGRSSRFSTRHPKASPPTYWAPARPCSITRSRP
jgi:flagellar biosynthesis protein FlhB